MRLLSAGWHAPIDPHDRSVDSYLNFRLLPLTISPFEDSKTDNEASHKVGRELDSEDGGDSVPKWLEIFFDLAWTATFSSLIQNTPIASLQPTVRTVASYIVFVGLVWWLWISQVIYDTKYFSNDWVHRISLLVYLCLFGGLAAFTQGFDITQGLHDDETPDPYLIHAFQAISAVFAVSRMLLALLYMRVLLYAKHLQHKGLSTTIIALLCSALMFIIAFVTLRTSQSRSVQVLKFVFWSLGISVEIVAFIVSGTTPRGLSHGGSMPERQATLTTIVLGEGLNGLIGPIVSTAQSVGFNARIGAQIFLVAFIVFLMFMLYFSSYQIRLAPSRARQKAIIFLHFPIQLFVILTLEGMKSILGLTSLLNTFDFLTGSFLSDQTPTAFLPFCSDDNNTPNGCRSALEAVGINFTFANASLYDLAAPADQPQFLPYDVTMKLVAEMLQKIYTDYDVLDDSSAAQWAGYINGTIFSSNASYSDAVAFGTQVMHGNLQHPFEIAHNLANLANDANNSQIGPIRWAAPVAGLLLLSLAATMIVNGMPFNRYMTSSMLTRVIMGDILLLFAAINVSDDALITWTGVGWILPSIAISLTVVYLIDYLIAIFMRRKLRKDQGKHAAGRPSPPSIQSHDMSQHSLPF